MITEFARDVLAQRGVKVVVPGEKERVVVSLSEETNEADTQTEQKNGAEEPTVNALVGEKCEVGLIDSSEDYQSKDQLVYKGLCLHVFIISHHLSLFVSLICLKSGEAKKHPIMTSTT